MTNEVTHNQKNLMEREKGKYNSMSICCVCIQLLQQSIHYENTHV